MFPQYVEFFAEQKGTDQEAKTAGLRQDIPDPSLTKQSKIMDTSVFTDAIPIEYLEDYKSILGESIMRPETMMEKMIRIIRKAHENGGKNGCCENNKDYEVYQSFFDFRTLKF